MGVWDTKQDCIDDIASGYAIARIYRGLADDHYGDAYTYLLGMDYFNCLLKIIQAWDDIYSYMSGMFVYDGNYTPPYGVPYCFQEYTGGDVTWQAIVEAWTYNDFEGRALTIAVIDRMRQILWDEPFNVQWASRPEEQET